MAELIRVSKVPLDRSYFCGRIQLNRPQKMNAFNLEMFQALQNALLNWQADESILYIFLDSSHEKAFSAGGDVSEVRQNHLTGETHFAQNYFKVEYGLDYFIHKFPKPILCWSQGVVMGAGLGVMNGCSHRIVTQNTLMAMPEVKIGLFPDVGASYFLNKISKNLGLFFALTGVSWSGEEACEFGLADFYLDSGDKEKVFSYLKSIPWGTFNRSEIHEVLNQELKQMETSLQKKEICLEGLDEVLQVNDFSEIHNIFSEFKTSSIFLNRAMEGYLSSSLCSRYLTFKRFKQAKNQSLREVFLRDWELAVAMTHEKDFYEGVRALLVDKDKKPSWSYSHLNEGFYNYSDKVFNLAMKNELSSYMQEVLSV